MDRQEVLTLLPVNAWGYTRTKRTGKRRTGRNVGI